MTNKEKLIERIAEIFDYYEEAALGSSVKIAKDICSERIASVWLEDVEKAKQEAEIALARKVIAVSGGHHKLRGFTQAKRLDLLTTEMNKIIPDVFGIAEETQTNE